MTLTEEARRARLTEDRDRAQRALEMLRPGGNAEVIANLEQIIEDRNLSLAEAQAKAA